MLVVLGLSLGRSAVYSVLSLADKLTKEVPLAQQTTSINTSATPERPWLDLAYQLANLVFPLMPVALVFYLMWVWQRPHGGPFRRMGFDLRRPGFDLGVGSLVFAGNLIMGLLFGWLYLRTKRVMPLVVVHSLLDIAAFVGYALLKPHLSWL